MRLHAPLHEGGSLLVQHRGQDARGHVHDGQAPAQVADALGALRADEPRAHDQHAAERGQRGGQGVRVVQRQEGELLLHLVQARHGRDKGARAGRDEQLVVGDVPAVGQAHDLLCGVDLCRRAAQQGRDAHLFIVVPRAVEHALLVRLAPEQVGDQGAGICVVGLGGDQRDGGGGVHPADALHPADGRGGIADDDVTHGFTSPHRRWRGSDSRARRRGCRRRSPGRARTSAPAPPAWEGCSRRDRRARTCSSRRTCPGPRG